MDKHKAGLVGLLAAAVIGCSSPNEATRAAQTAGWRNVAVTEYEYFFNFTCGAREMAYRITGENPRGGKANATVCCGYMKPSKGCTIRY